MGEGPPVDLRSRILRILAEHRTMAVATVRADGWPQTTIVGYVNVELDLYFAIARASQKFANIQRDGRISIAIGGAREDEPILGLSLAAHAHAGQ